MAVSPRITQHEYRHSQEGDGHSVSVSGFLIRYPTLGSAKK